MRDAHKISVDESKEARSLGTCDSIIKSDILYHAVGEK
jgi:hypothetical protein